MSSSRWLAVVSVEEQRAEEQLRRLIGDDAYAVWETAGRIHIPSKLGGGHWSIVKPYEPALVRLEYWYGGAQGQHPPGVEQPGRISNDYRRTPHCVGAAWGFKGPIPKADQVIALCLWLHADEEAVSSKAFPRVASMPRAHRAKHWDAIFSGHHYEEPMKDRGRLR